MTLNLRGTPLLRRNTRSAVVTIIVVDLVVDLYLFRYSNDPTGCLTNQFNKRLQ